MKEQLNKKQVEKDLIFMALRIMKASKELQEIYNKINEIYENLKKN